MAYLLPVGASLLVAVEEEDELQVDLLSHGLVPANQVVLIPRQIKLEYVKWLLYIDKLTPSKMDSG